MHLAVFLRQGFAIQARLITASLVNSCDALEYHARKHRNGLRYFEQHCRMPALQQELDLIAPE